MRTERLFKEDRIMALSIIPLLARMGLVHVVLIWGTNNTTSQGLTPIEINHREIGSRLVLASRIMYAMLWVTRLFASGHGLADDHQHMDCQIHDDRVSQTSHEPYMEEQL